MPNTEDYVWVTASVNKYVQAAVKYGLQMHWVASDMQGLMLMAMTVMAENGGHKYRKLMTAQSIQTALGLSLEIYTAGGKLDCDALMDDVFWQYGWDPETMHGLREKLRETAASMKWRETNWFGWWNWKKEQAKQ